MKKIFNTGILAILLAYLPLTMVTAEYDVDEPHFQIQIAPAYMQSELKWGKDKGQKFSYTGPAIRGEASFLIGDGWLIRPSALYGWSKQKLKPEVIYLNAQPTSYLGLDLTFGKQIPLSEQFMVTPLIGVNWQQLKGSIKNKSIEESDEFSLLSPYLGIEGVYSITPQFRIRGNAKYYALGKSTLSKKGKEVKEYDYKHKGSASGPSFGLGAEYDINENWSVNIGGSYSLQNLNLKEDKKLKKKGENRNRFDKSSFSTKEAHIGISYSF